MSAATKARPARLPFYHPTMDRLDRLALTLMKSDLTTELEVGWCRKIRGELRKQDRYIGWLFDGVEIPWTDFRPLGIHNIFDRNGRFADDDKERAAGWFWRRFETIEAIAAKYGLSEKPRPRPADAFPNDDI